MDAASEQYCSDVADALTHVLQPSLSGVYLHGSAVLGGFDADLSDVDVLAVCAGPISAAAKRSVSRVLSGHALPCPARGLELSIVTVAVAHQPTAEPMFELHVTTAVGHSKAIDGEGHPGDPDLVLHFAVCRATGRLLGTGLPADQVFAPVPLPLLINRLAGELAWARENAATEYAVLNACRAWRFLRDRKLVSKLDGGQWARNRVGDADRALIDIALARQRGATERPERAATRAFVLSVESELRHQSHKRIPSGRTPGHGASYGTTSIIARFVGFQARRRAVDVRLVRPR